MSKLRQDFQDCPGDTDGVTHQGTEDIGIVRTLPNMTLLCPADAVAAEAFVKMAADIEGPVYLRLGRGATPILYDENQTFTPGQAVRVRSYGEKLVIIACGPCGRSSAGGRQPEGGRGIEATVLDMHTIKPIDKRNDSRMLRIGRYCYDCRGWHNLHLEAPWRKRFWKTISVREVLRGLA